MNRCAEFERLLEGLMAGDYERSPDGSLPRRAEAARREIRTHVDGCDACGDLFGFHEWLTREALGIEEPGAADLEAMRRGVLARIRMEEGTEPAAHRRASWWRRLFFRPAPYRALTSPPRLRPAFVAAAAVLLFAAGVIAGRALPAGRSSSGASPPGFASIESAPYLLSNVSLHPAGQGQVKLAFDVTRRVRTERPGDDPLVREALLQSIRGASPLGDRLKALSLATGYMDPEIRATLVQVVANDPSLPVRLRALEALGRDSSAPDVQKALLKVLTEDASVQMRLLAIDYLGGAQVPPELIRDALEETRPEGARAVRVRAGEKLGF
ncbi:MAG TPA: HEAT repeat domain-containing protein [Candidatus Saccharimonadales bacterium]|nr:HEAT repeat domain-containing protein [Candidatus Saccharimonadales bacterium]